MARADRGRSIRYAGDGRARVQDHRYACPWTSGHCSQGWALTRDEKEGRFGLAATLDDMDWHVRCVHSLALDLERLTGVVVHPHWDMEHQSMTEEDKATLSFVGQLLTLSADAKSDVVDLLRSWNSSTPDEREAAGAAFTAKHGAALERLAGGQP